MSKENSTRLEYRKAWANRKRREAGIPAAKRSRIEDGKKLCMHCEEMKAFSHFTKATRGLGGIAAYCKPCMKERYYDRVAMMHYCHAYRQRHEGRVRANSRITNAIRATRISVTDDGTVTSAFLHDLYSTVNCYYCEEPTSRFKRTADHKIPLARGGLHSADNMVMACQGCNSSKRDMTDEEFRSSRTQGRARKDDIRQRVPLRHTSSNNASSLSKDGA